MNPAPPVTTMLTTAQAYRARDVPPLPLAARRRCRASGSCCSTRSTPTGSRRSAARRRVRAASSPTFVGARARRRAVERHRGAAPRAGAARCAARATTCSCRRSRSWRRRTRSPTSARGRCSSTATAPPGTSIPRWSRRSSLPAPAPDASSRPRCIGVDLYGQCADWDPILASCARVRRAGDRGRGRGARGDVPRPPRRLVRRAERVLVQRQQDHHHERRRDADGRRPGG